jgi:hypothetical protein
MAYNIFTLMEYELKKSLEMAYAEYDYDYDMRVQIFSFGWYKNKIICIGKNKNKTHPLNITKNPIYFDDKILETKTTCAELDLFLKLKRKTNIPYNKLKIVNVRLDKNMNIRNSKCCRSCASLITYMKPKSIYYTTDNGNFEIYE